MIKATANGIKALFRFIMSFVDALFNKHKLVRRFVVFWSLAVSTYAILHNFPADKLAIITGQTTVAFGLYKWSRDRDK